MSIAISGKKREALDYQEFIKKVGVMEVSVLAVNPDAQQYETITGITPKEDSTRFNYIDTNKDGDDRVRLTFLIKDKKTGGIYELSFWLENKVRRNKDDNATQYINNACEARWVKDEKGVDGLPEYFTSRGYRKALVGEEELYSFLRYWVQLDFFNDPTAQLHLDAKKFFKGNYKELQDLVNSEWTRVEDKKGTVSDATVVVLATIRTKEVEGETKTSQVINNRHFLPGYCIKNFQNRNWTKTDAEAIQKKLDSIDDLLQEVKQLKDGNPEKTRINAEIKELKKTLKVHEKFVAAVMDKDYPVNEYFGGYIGMLRDYDPTENMAAGQTVMKETDPKDSSY